MPIPHSHPSALDATLVEPQARCAAFEQAIQLQPKNPQLYFQLAACQWRLGLLEAHASFTKAIELAPRLAMAHAALAAWYLQQGLVEQADRASAIAMQIAPRQGAILQSRAAVLEAMGELDPSWNLVQQLVQSRFTPIPVLRLYGRMARFQGRAEQALQLVQQEMTAPNRSARDQACLHFTAADLLDSLRRFDEAFDNGRRGNELTRVPYDPKAHDRSFRTLIDYFTKDRLARLPRASDRSNKPVFIVGMPRSGSSLVEQMLASHPDVHGCGELDFMSHVWAGTVHMLSASPAEYPGCLDRITMDQVDGMSQIYLQPLLAMSPTAARLTDKLPLNFLHLGLVALLLPGARIIDCRRDPRDTCLSCYLAMFEGGNDFKQDLDHSARFYLQYRRLMQHWHQSLEIPILDVSYESLVTQPEMETRRMLNFLDLSWHPGCLDFHQHRRAVITSSTQQVRTPLFTSSIGRWRNYERHLDGLNRWFESTQIL